MAEIIEIVWREDGALEVTERFSTVKKEPIRTVGSLCPTDSIPVESFEKRTRIIRDEAEQARIIRMAKAQGRP